MVISPPGAVTFLSQLWGGNAFDLLRLLGVTLNISPKRDSSRPLTREDVEQTTRIAAVGIHVERKMKQINNFRILKEIIPATEWDNVNNIVLICTALTNLEPPLVK